MTTNKYEIKGQVTGIKAKDAKIIALALVGGREVARSSIATKGTYTLSFEAGEIPQNTIVRFINEGGGASTESQIPASAFNRHNGTFSAEINPIHLRPFPPISFKIHGCVIISKDHNIACVVKGARIDFVLGIDPATERKLGCTYTDPTGNYDFEFSMPFFYLLKGLSVRARIFQFIGGDWQTLTVGYYFGGQCYTMPDGDVADVSSTDFTWDITVVNALQAQSEHTPPEGFQFGLIGCLPIIQALNSLSPFPPSPGIDAEGYYTSQPGDVVQVSAVPFSGRLSITGYFASGKGKDPRVVKSYRVQYRKDASNEWIDITCPLINHKFQDPQSTFKNIPVQVTLGPDPQTKRYRNIDCEPDYDWLEHSLKIRWDTAALPLGDGLYSLQIIGYDIPVDEVVADAELASHTLVTQEMPASIFITNTMPIAQFEVISPTVGKCGGLTLALDRKVTVNITAFDHGGHVSSWTFSGCRGKSKVQAFEPISDSRDKQTPWKKTYNGFVGSKDIEIADLATDLADCKQVSYELTLSVCSAMTDGYHVISGSAFCSQALIIAEPD